MKPLTPIATNSVVFDDNNYPLLILTLADYVKENRIIQTIIKQEIKSVSVSSHLTRPDKEGRAFKSSCHCLFMKGCTAKYTKIFPNPGKISTSKWFG